MSFTTELEPKVAVVPPDSILLLICWKMLFNAVELLAVR